MTVLVDSGAVLALTFDRHFKQYGLAVAGRTD